MGSKSRQLTKDPREPERAHSHITRQGQQEMLIRESPALTPVGFSISWCSSVTSVLFDSPVVPHWRSPSRPRHVTLGGICEEVDVVESGFDRKKVWVWLICAGPRLRLVRMLWTEHMKSRFLPVVFAGLFRRFLSWPCLPEPAFESAIFLCKSSTVLGELGRSRSTIYNLIVKANDAVWHACARPRLSHAKPDFWPSPACPPPSNRIKLSMNTQAKPTEMK